MFKVIFAMKDIGKCETFGKAIEMLFAAVDQAFKEGGLSYQVLETTVYIVYTLDGTDLCMGFYDARDLAHDLRLVGKGGKMLPHRELSPDEMATLKYRFLDCHVSEMIYATRVGRG